MRQQLRIGVLARLDALAPHATDLLPQFGAVLQSAHVDQQVSKHRDPHIDVEDHLQCQNGGDSGHTNKPGFEPQQSNKIGIKSCL